MVDHKSVVVAVVVVVAGVVVGTSGCGLLNGFTEGDVDSPLAGVFEGEGDGGCVSDDDCGNVCDVDSGECVDCVESGDCDGQICADNACVDCVVLDDCGEGEVCSGDNECVEAAEGEGEGEGEGPVFTIAPAPVESGNCTATSTTLSNGDGDIPADILLPEGWLSAPAPHVVVFFHEFGGSPLSWRSPSDVACSMALRDVASVLVDLGNSDGLNGENPYALVLGAVEAELVERGRIGVVAASATAIDFHEYLGVVDGAGGYEKVVYLSGGADFAPTAEEIDAIGELYPDDVLFMAAQDDAQCEPAPPACADYVTEMAAAESANHVGWSFVIAEGSAHGSDLVTGNDDVVSISGDDFVTVGTPATVALLNFFDPAF